MKPAESDRLVDVFDDYDEATGHRDAYAAQLVRLRLADKYGVFIAYVPYAGYGVYVGKHPGQAVA